MDRLEMEISGLQAVAMADLKDAWRDLAFYRDMQDDRLRSVVLSRAIASLNQAKERAKRLERALAKA